MTETPTHTPLPWVANDKHSGANPWRIETDDGVWANDGWIIAECCGPEAEANAAFIVHAVNSHHRLIEALEFMRGFGCPVCSGDCGSANPPVMSCPMLMIDAALKEARHG